MPKSGSIDEIIANAVSKAMLNIVPVIQRQVATMAAEELDKRLSMRNGRRASRPSGRARARTAITRWVADRRARRVPTFVIELTGGLDTNKRIVAKYGENAVFEKGKPAPKPSK